MNIKEVLKHRKNRPMNFFQKIWEGWYWFSECFDEWVRTMTNNHSNEFFTDQLRSQRQRAHQGERNRRKKRPGTTPEERKWEKFSPNKPKNVALQDRKREGYPTDISSRKKALISMGERRRSLRQQAINAIRRSLGSGYTD